MYKIEYNVDHFKEVIAQMGLTELWTRIQKNNPSANAPYHSNEHMFGVAMIASQLYAQSIFSHPTGAMYLSTRRDLVIACLLHDYNHSMGVESDSINIDRALKALAGVEKILYLSGNRIEKLISITEYPFLYEPDDCAGGCIRDADLLYSLLHPDPRRILDGLRQEMEVSFKRSIDMKEMIELQEKFWSTVTFYTPAAIELTPLLIKTHLERCRKWAEETDR